VKVLDLSMAEELNLDLQHELGQILDRAAILAGSFGVLQPWEEFLLILHVVAEPLKADSLTPVPPEAGSRATCRAAALSHAWPTASSRAD
jgi:hypothetical protein